MSHAAEYDAHGHSGHHGHVIVSQWTLRAVLGALLFFTLLTVGLSLAETWIAGVFHIHLPGWVNVAVALAIAAVKTIIVVAFFMQLKYDNPLNTMVLVFTVLTVMFFLGFIALDLCQRDTIDRTKALYVIEGGTGLTGLKADGTVAAGLSNIPMTEAAKMVARNKAAAGGHDTHAAHAPAGPDRGPLQSVTDAGFANIRPHAGSSSQVSRPVTGITIPGLPGYIALDEHGGHTDHADHAAPDKPAAPGDKSEPKKDDHAAPAPPAPPAPAAKPH